MYAVWRATDLSNWFQSSLELQSPKCLNHHAIDSTSVVHLSLNVMARDKVIPRFLYWLLWCGMLSFFFSFIDLRNRIRCEVSQDPKERQIQIKSARSRCGTWMNSSTEGSDTGFADVLAENHLYLILRESVFQQINIVWPIVSKCINHYYQTHTTLEHFKISVSK